MSSSVPKTKIVTAFRKRGSGPLPATELGDATMEFAAESAVAVQEPNPGPRRDRRRQIAAVVLGVLVLGLIAAGAYWKDAWPLRAAAVGSLRIESDPTGARVRLNGTERGLTPLALSVPAGNYTLTVQHGPNSKDMAVSVSNGASTVYHIALADTPKAPAVETGQLTIATDPAGSEVVVDGVTRGVAPLTLQDLPIGQHRVLVRARGTTYTRTVEIEAGATASLFFGGSQAAAMGSIAIESPISVRVFEEQRLIGTSDMDRIMVPAGEHLLELTADSVGFRTTRTVRVTAGQTAALLVDLPRAPVSINALPWAEVFIDGTRIGETPLGNVPQTLGPHEIVFRHPQLGERRVNALVTMKETTRISVDMRQR